MLIELTFLTYCKLFWGPFSFHLFLSLFLHSFYCGSTLLWPQRRGQLGGLSRIVILDWHQHMMAFLLLPLLWSAPVTLAHGQPIQAHRKKKGVASFRGFSPEQLPLVRQLYLKPLRRGEVQCRQQLLHLLLVAQPSVDNPKLFIHTEALVVPGQEVEVGAEVGPALGWVIRLHFSCSHYHFIY